MTDIVLETIRTLILLFIVYFLWRAGKNRAAMSRGGWRLIIGGFLLLLFGSALDITDNFESLNRFVVIGDTEVEAFLEKMVGFLAGFFVLSMGLMKWIPTVTHVRESEELAAQLSSANAELRVLNAKLLKSNEELDIFTRAASHDLQEPLRKIQTFIDRLQSGTVKQLTEKEQDYFSRMRAAAARMQGLVQDLISLSHIVSQEQNSASVDLNTVAQNVISNLELRIEETGGEVTISDLPKIHGIESLLEQLFQNIIDNSLKYHKRDEKPEVTVRSQLVDDEARPVSDGTATSCQLLFEDNGIGFDEKYRDRIFEMFQRLHGKSAYEGNGIGLAICKRIVERHGGQIVAKSTAGGGATFIVTLPLHANGSLSN